MTGSADGRAGARTLVRALRNLGAPRQAERALVAGPQGHDLARAVAEMLSPSELVLIHPVPATARSRFRTTPDDLPGIARSEPESRDLVLISGGLEAADLAAAREAVLVLAGLLRPGGVLAAVIDTLAAPDCEGVAAPFDHLLFPQLARQGALGEAAQTRAPLPGGAWMLMLQEAGLDVTAAAAAAQPEDLERAMAEHATRLAAYDRQEVAQGRLHVLARAPGGQA